MVTRALVTFILGITLSMAEENLTVKTLPVEGVERRGLLYLPPEVERKPRAVVLAFHGHGGSAQGFAKIFPIHRHLPDAIVVYLQGLPTVGKLTDPEGKKSGWQNGPGENGDRDLKLVDATLSILAGRYPLSGRTFATGHSHGGAFVYQLWLSRGERFTAFAPMAALLGDTNHWTRLVPKPCFHLAGEKDPLVRYPWQVAMVDYVKKLNQCAGAGVVLEDGFTRKFESAIGLPLVTFIHSGGHEVPAQAAQAVGAFFLGWTIP